MVVNRYIVALFFEKEKMNMKRILKTLPRCQYFVFNLFVTRPVDFLFGGCYV